MSWIWQAQGGGSSGGGGRPPIVSTLQPLNYSGNIVAAYAFDDPAAPCNVDRSGNGRNFVGVDLASDMANLPDDLIRPTVGIVSAPPYGAGPLFCRQTSNAWLQTGQFTLAHRFFMSAPVDAVEHCFGAERGTPVAGSTSTFQWGTLSHNLYYFAVTPALAPILFTSTLQVTPNRWWFVTVRRRVDNTVRLGLGSGPSSAQQTYQDSGPLAATGEGPVSNPRTLKFGDSIVGNVPMAGLMKDFVFWNRFLSDAELVPQYAAAMRGVNGP